MIEQKEADGWTFSFFGANQDAWDSASSYGISTQASTQSVGNHKGAWKGAMRGAAVATTQYRATGSYTVSDPDDDQQ